MPSDWYRSFGLAAGLLMLELGEFCEWVGISVLRIYGFWFSSPALLLLQAGGGFLSILTQP